MCHLKFDQGFFPIKYNVRGNKSDVLYDNLNKTVNFQRNTIIGFLILVTMDFYHISVKSEVSPQAKMRFILILKTILAL